MFLSLRRGGTLDGAADLIGDRNLSRSNLAVILVGCDIIKGKSDSRVRSDNEEEANSKRVEA